MFRYILQVSKVMRNIDKDYTDRPITLAGYLITEVLVKRTVSRVEVIKTTNISSMEAAVNSRRK